jgi:hypothetical protein
MGASIRTLDQCPAADAVTALCDLQVSTQDISLTAPEDKIHSNVYPFLATGAVGFVFRPVRSALAPVLASWIPTEPASANTSKPQTTGFSRSKVFFFAALVGPGSLRLHGFSVLSHGYEDLAGQLRLLRATIDGHSMDAGWQVVIDGMIRSVV